nr:MAG: hypothetical protein [Bacteriophage sp.]
MISIAKKPDIDLKFSSGTVITSAALFIVQATESEIKYPSVAKVAVTVQSAKVIFSPLAVKVTSR